MNTTSTRKFVGKYEPHNYHHVSTIDMIPSYANKPTYDNVAIGRKKIPHILPMRPLAVFIYGSHTMLPCKKRRVIL